jgi:hypothetical protein
LIVPHTFSPGTPAKSSEVNENFTTIYNEVTALKKQINGTSCATIHAQSSGLPSGIYSIQPAGSTQSIQAFCDMVTDGGGWTLVAKLFELTLPTGAVGTDKLTTNAQPNSGEESKLADATINALGYLKVRVIPSGAPAYTPFFFQPGTQWNFSGGSAGNLNGVPVCDDADLTVNCVTRTGVADGGYAGYRNYNGTNDHAFIFNHPGNLGYAGRVPYGEDQRISATVWVR